MPRKLAPGIIALAGLCTSLKAQEIMRVTYSWTEVIAGTNTPVASPNFDLEPGEGARITLTIAALINGTNAVGQTVTYTPPPPPGVGTVRGIGSFVYDMFGDLGAASAAGTWTNLLGPPAPVNTAGTPGTPGSGGAVITGMGGAQFIIPGGTANGANNIQVFRGVWNPSSYAVRVVNFKAAPSTTVPSGQQNSMLLCFGVAQPDPSDPTTWYDRYYNKYVGTDFGNGVNIPIGIPAPTSFLFLSPMLFRRRRRFST